MNNDPLKNQRRKVRRAEAALARARDELRTAAQQNGLPTAGIFAESEFVWRTTADRWAKEARREAFDVAAEELSGIIKVLKDPASSPFAHLAKPNPDGSDIEPGRSAPEVARKPLLVVDNTAVGESA